MADGEVVSSADDDKGLVNALYVNDDLLIVDVTGAMNGKNADDVAKDGAYNTVDLSKVDGNLFRSFQLVNRYTGETYGKDFVAYDSEYEIQFVAKADGVLYVDLDSTDGTDDLDAIIPFSAGDNTDNNSEKIYIPVDNNVTVWTGAADEEETGNGEVLLNMTSGSATFGTDNAGNEFKFDMVARGTDNKVGFANMKVYNAETGGRDVTNEFDETASTLYQFVQDANNRGAQFELATKDETPAGKYWVEVEYDNAACKRVMIEVAEKEIDSITFTDIKDANMDATVANIKAQAETTEGIETIKVTVGEDNKTVTVTITTDSNHVFAEKATVNGFGFDNGGADSTTNYADNHNIMIRVGTYTFA